MGNMDELDLKIMFADTGTIELRTIAFNRSGVDVYFHLDEDGQELVIAGAPSNVTHPELVDIFEYLLEVVKDESLAESLETSE